MRIYIGTVVELDADGTPLVRVPELGAHAHFRPTAVLEHGLAIGERIAVGQVGGTRHALALLGRINARPPAIEEVPGLVDTLDAHDARLDTLSADADADQLTLDNHGDRLTANEALDGQQNDRLTATEGVANGAASAAATAGTAAATAQDTAATAQTAVGTLRADTAGRATTKGDLLAATGAGVLARQAVGANGLVLVADSAQATGLAYAERRGTALGLTGATTPTRYVGATSSGAPTTGTFAVGDFVVDVTTAVVWLCSAAGTPGTWVNASSTRPLGHVGRTDAFQDILDGAYVQFSTAQILRGGMTFNNTADALVVPKTGTYRLTAKGYFTGGTGYQGQTFVTRNETARPPVNPIGSALIHKTDSADYTGLISELITLTQNDLIRLYLAGISTWGTNGYDGSYLELEYKDQ